MYELIIIWSSGEKEINKYESREQAEQAEQGYKMAFGNQVAWSGINHKNY